MADDDREARRAEADARFEAWVGELGDPGGTMLAAGYAYPERKIAGELLRAREALRAADELADLLAEREAAGWCAVCGRRIHASDCALAAYRAARGDR